MAPIAGLTSHVVAAMVARAVDVVIYQKHFEDEGARRVAEVLELERPGVTFGPTGEISYRLTAARDAGAQKMPTWTYPEEPSPRLRRALELKGFQWPVGSDGATDCDERTVPDGRDR